MAYSNWGSKVFKDDVRRNDKEDVGVFDCDEAVYPSGARIFANILKGREKGYPEGEQPWHEHSHHAVLGDNEVRLCGYKSYPELWVMREGKVEKFVLPEPDYDKDEWELKDQTGEVEVDGKKWKWGFSQYDSNMIDLWLHEPDGSRWHSTCGYCFGAGFE